ncbi:MarR family transcriptional regulator [Crossiella sp. CA-258035]|uniref:MarR family winged helix-turn-helix transcriptional regulator n=1 Tax=Crossiella sp. CA-258035 TaxID=2981138 RepID=UPI0024BCF3BC|nr:MarR family transcriptional regulator [Crossiella sp. CA-258035]WHT22591.1 MarR family transcriptional regulator [Crossiella sp. CA-258035]
MTPALTPPPPEYLTGMLAEAAELLEVRWERAGDPSPAPLSVSQIRNLYVLERAGVMSLRELGEALGPSPPSMSRLCDRLQTIGFIELRQNPADRREPEIRISKTGRTYLREVRVRRQSTIAELLTAVPAPAQHALCTGLRHFLAAENSSRPQLNQHRAEDTDAT